MATEAGLTPRQYKSMTLYEIGLVIKGYDKRMRIQWEIAREGWFYTVRFGNVDPRTAPRRVEEVRSFPWDNPLEIDEEVDPMAQALADLRKKAEEQRVQLNENSNGQ